MRRHGRLDNLGLSLTACSTNRYRHSFDRHSFDILFYCEHENDVQAVKWMYHDERPADVQLSWSFQEGELLDDDCMCGSRK